MDAKCRVSIPSDWRMEIGGGVLRLLVSHNEKLPCLKVLTVAEFEKMQHDINTDEDMSAAERRLMIGMLFERCTKTQINEQGKLSIPKALLEHPEVNTGEEIALCGRGNYFEILSLENHKQLTAVSTERMAALNEKLGIF
ncbi:hypothetical protein HW115_11805 [Verrucomicrobiaceae bacterium N1E253]|uniref:Transcriptional regulator MraZ n=1 Tax=Oceaniferula marina TaxID=2748318 RepID=A0A851GEW7_9BACT|nr:hypothetical protein [Oceaniferula marina]NWK56298.1 hypothetical protein [Oceaniferula marina]